ncbi:UvrD-helicase domain-containing protein [Bacteroidales bacterium OttesenSCG-928-K22]|nr:UvrD-helicase domain-containing protein [Bacteroidales bacterium OttesenSCG-928-K22]
MFKVINASAGSGKTYNLVKEYLILLFQDTENYKHILAITFTNKATAEMKERIISALEHIANPAKFPNSNVVNNMLPEILQECPKINPNEIQLIAQKCLTKILHNYSELAVSTIDSFSHKIIRAFSHDMELAAGFSIELHFEKLVDEAVSNLIARAGNDQVLTEFLINYIDHLHENKSNQDFEKPIKDIGKILSDDKIRVLLENDNFMNLDILFFKNIIQKLYAEIYSLEKKIKDVANDTNKAISDANLSINDFAKKSTGIGNYFNKVLKDIYKDNTNPTTLAPIEDYDNDNLWATKDGNRVGVIGIKPIIRDNFNKIQELLKELNDHQIIMENIYTFALLNEIAKEIDIIKTEENVLPIAEFNTKISDIVALSEAPYIYERIGEKYNYLMIDEFQDTSTLQWQNILPLIDNSLANNFTNLIVGDGKQAIYIWRNGEVRQFTSLPKIYQSISPEDITLNRENSFARNIQKINLDRNFRSAKTIVNFNNSFFKYFSENNNWIKDEAYTSIYDYAIFQQKANSSNTGYVEIDVFESEKIKAVEFQKFNIEKTYQIIEKLHNEYEYDYGDIAVMCYKSSEGQMIAGYLLEKGINVVSPDSLSLTSSNKVQFICSIIKMLSLQSNEVDLNMCLKYLCITNDKQQIFESLSKSIDKKAPHIKSFSAVCESFDINFDTTKLSFYSGYELCEYLIELFNLDNNDIFIQRFLNIFQENPSLTITEFPEWLDENEKDLKISSTKGIDAVHIMTIHKSKGLEFPVVICAFTDYKLPSGNTAKYLYVNNKSSFKHLKSHLVKHNSSLINSSYEDEYLEEKESQYLDKINLLYVALTRAKEQLYILTKRQKVSDEKKTKTSDTFSIDKIICDFIDNEECSSLHPFKIDDNTITFGELNKKTKKETYQDETIDLESIYSDWRTRIKIATPNKTYYDSDDSNGYSSEQIRWGNKFHALMSRIKTADDIKLISHFIDKKEVFNIEEKELFFKIFNSMINNENIFNLLFDYDKVYFEKEMLSSEGQIFRADRITVKNGVYNIIDFKTGEESLKDIKQIENYCEILRTMGHNDVKGYIIYCWEDVKLVEIVSKNLF